MGSGRDKETGIDITNEKIVITIFRRYFSPDESDWDGRFADLFTGELGLEMDRTIPETVVMRDQSYRPTQFVKEMGDRRPMPAQAVEEGAASTHRRG